MEEAMVSSERKIVILTGPESTGKTLIAKRLTHTFKGSYVPEYAREYISNINRTYNYSDILHIANRQFEKYNGILKESHNQLFFIDTYLIITKVWFVWHSGNYPNWIDEAILNTKDILYLLCAPDIKWESDDVRENGGANRIKLFNEYKNELENYNLDYRIVTGKNELRQKNAVKFVAEYFSLHNAVNR